MTTPQALPIGRFMAPDRPLTEGERAQLQAIEAVAFDLADLIMRIPAECTGAARAKALACTKLEESVLWARRGLSA